MTDAYDSKIAEIAELMQKDGLSPDEQDSTKFTKYSKFANDKYGMDEQSSAQLIFEALLYLKLKNSKSADPLQDGDKFGVGFS